MLIPPLTHHSLTTDSLPVISSMLIPPPTFTHSSLTHYSPTTHSPLTDYCLLVVGLTYHTHTPEPPFTHRVLTTQPPHPHHPFTTDPTLTHHPPPTHHTHDCITPKRPAGFGESSRRDARQRSRSGSKWRRYSGPCLTAMMLPLIRALRKQNNA